MQRCWLKYATLTVVAFFLANLPVGVGPRSVSRRATRSPGAFGHIEALGSLQVFNAALAACGVRPTCMDGSALCLVYLIPLVWRLAAAESQAALDNRAMQ